ncbi:MAG: 50S ribosomal protein L17 [Ignavibacteria bacterium]|jgi:large subunit ribosomal protein L17
MRHRVKGGKLGRTVSHRKATLRALATALLKHKRIKTTIAKAKAAREFVEPLITKAKNDTVHSRRLIARSINDKDVVKELFTDIVEKIGDRPGGYTRIVKLGQRLGDASEMAILELVDFFELGEKETTPKRESKKAPKEEKVEDSVEDAQVIEETSTDEETVEDEAAEEKEENKEEVKAEAAEEVPEEKEEDKPDSEKESK